MVVRTCFNVEFIIQKLYNTQRHKHTHTRTQTWGFFDRCRAELYTLTEHFLPCFSSRLFCLFLSSIMLHYPSNTFPTQKHHDIYLLAPLGVVLVKASSLSSTLVWFLFFVYVYSYICASFVSSFFLSQTIPPSFYVRASKLFLHSALFQSLFPTMQLPFHSLYLSYSLTPFPSHKSLFSLSLTFSLSLSHIWLFPFPSISLSLSFLFLSPPPQSIELYRGLKPLKGSSHVLLIAAFVLTLSQHYQGCWCHLTPLSLTWSYTTFPMVIKIYASACHSHTRWNQQQKLLIARSK